MTSLSPAVQSVLELFKGPLSNVRFADIDAAGLAQLAAEVETAAAEVEEQKAKLTELEQGLAQRQEALLVLAQRALAYARVYAENDEPLLEELNQISLPRPAKPRAVKQPRNPAASKANGARDAARAEPTHAGADAGSDSEAEPIEAESIEAESIEAESIEAESTVERLDSELDAAPAEAAEASPPRNARKTRGAAARRAAN